jgi:uncharacterized protein (DUF433 family)
MTTVLDTHIRLDARGVAWIDDMNVKVIEVALDHTAARLTPEEIFHAHNGYLSRAQVHAALAYYYDNQASIDAEIERQAREYDQLRNASLDSPIRQKLRALGKIP